VPERLTYTVPEIAELLGISRSSAYQCVRRGEIPALVLGRRVVVARAALDALLTNFVDASGVAPSEGPDDRAD
jgi:excisionase family DNA binding protein